jgi:hypothetical protein
MGLWRSSHDRIPPKDYSNGMNSKMVLNGDNGRTSIQKSSALTSGMLAGAAGLLTFLVIHAFWIVPIWFILPMGLVIAIPGGLAVGWGYSQVADRLPSRPLRAPVLMGLIAIILLPATTLAELRQPMFALTPQGAIFQSSIPRGIFIFVAELLSTASITGGLLGWWLGGTRKAAAAMALAGAIFALGPGHNIPFIGGTGGVFKEWAILGSVIFVAALVLVEAQVHLSKLGGLLYE